MLSAIFKHSFNPLVTVLKAHQPINLPFHHNAHKYFAAVRALIMLVYRADDRGAAVGAGVLDYVLCKYDLQASAVFFDRAVFKVSEAYGMPY